MDSGVDTNIMNSQVGKTLNNQQPMFVTKHGTITRTSSMKNNNDCQLERDRRVR